MELKTKFILFGLILPNIALADLYQCYLNDDSPGAVVHTLKTVPISDVPYSNGTGRQVSADEQLFYNNGFSISISVYAQFNRVDLYINRSIPETFTPLYASTITALYGQNIQYSKAKILSAEANTGVEDYGPITVKCIFSNSSEEVKNDK